VVGDGGGSSKLFDLTDGVEVSGFGLSFVDASDAFVEGLPLTVGGFIVFGISGADSAMESSFIAPLLST
jgi:hypothetical protein